MRGTSFDTHGLRTGCDTADTGSRTSPPWVTGLTDFHFCTNNAGAATLLGFVRGHNRRNTAQKKQRTTHPVWCRPNLPHTTPSVVLHSTDSMEASEATPPLFRPVSHGTRREVRRSRPLWELQRRRVLRTPGLRLISQRRHLATGDSSS